MTSIYHILDRIPAIYKQDMEIEYEYLAMQLIKSGKLRIDTNDCCNFARFTDPALNINLMISKEELTKPHLIPETTKLFQSLYKNSASDQKINSIFDNLKKQIQKLQPVKKEVTEMLARLFVQSAHPIVIRWLLLNKTEVFLTYSHNIGDMMDIVSWQRVGGNSGMQSTNGKDVAIFVSCGGNPFAENNKEHPSYGDGFAAVARLQIIAAQELGHFADIKRDDKGRQLTRHAANFSGTKATDKVRIARKSDIIHCNNLFNKLLNAGMKKQLEYETKLKFYNTNKINGVKVNAIKCMILIYKFRLLNYSSKNNLIFIRKFKTYKYMALMLEAMFKDMQDNLSPNAEVYKNKNPEIEEAIACIEALARVPQQTIKWGYLTTKETMHHLYKIYYNEVIPSLITSYNSFTGENYKRNLKKPKSSFFSKINIFSNKKLILKPVREL
ncbi:DUF2748 family protein [Rickettsia prowazekii]|uniref:Uncharacterized protein RP034 n=2 Tax=Rickettsia prowazekii TaxID=782 RepID=Y034_RICPR|nr:DUF2748 family protein [Rickettsia prowazekii]Q9ZEB1.1 RecName: Full=Uncharacterized protein RP034 [Rickettsia prowazekii str. Madrid E]ADE29545.1 hypothetical protein rpr22_CDS032 [Rickettsia prowazekii str. Rp22]AFE48864.1 hypothetical protein M9W_00155 [Rickettsia prowazekii str. Chernikova]AFE49709.1 hypothetical protein M9Y_00155 [Rickettsia prowazekii str. Katsinyian]AFE50553.1 hypothetical protein MA1_00155 [Rickettsia prowazekii str. BuV67-CWPP]AFE51395.1 hypothetical protein MA3_0